MFFLHFLSKFEELDPLFWVTENVIKSFLFQFLVVLVFYFKTLVVLEFYYDLCNFFNYTFICSWLLRTFLENI